MGGVIGIAVGVVIGLFAAVLGIGSMGAGHGDYFHAKLLFPFTMAISGAIGHIPAPIAFASLVQFPLYGWWIGRTPGIWDRLRVLVFIVALHGAAAVIAFATAAHFG